MFPTIPLYLFFTLPLLRGSALTRNLNDLYNKVNHNALENDHHEGNFKRMDFALGWSLLDMWMNEPDESKIIDHERKISQYASSCSAEMLHEIFVSYAPSKLWGRSPDSDVSLLMARVRDTRSELEALESASAFNLYHLNVYQNRWLKLLTFLEKLAIQPLPKTEWKDEEARSRVLQHVLNLLNGEDIQELEKSIQHLQWSEGLERMELISLCHGMFKEAIQGTSFAKESEPARQRMSLLQRRLDSLGTHNHSYIFCTQVTKIFIFYPFITFHKEKPMKLLAFSFFGLVSGSSEWEKRRRSGKIHTSQKLYDAVEMRLFEQNSFSYCDRDFPDREDVVKLNGIVESHMIGVKSMDDSVDEFMDEFDKFDSLFLRNIFQEYAETYLTPPSAEPGCNLEEMRQIASAKIAEIDASLANEFNFARFVKLVQAEAQLSDLLSTRSDFSYNARIEKFNKLQYTEPVSVTLSKSTPRSAGVLSRAQLEGMRFVERYLEIPQESVELRSIPLDFGVFLEKFSTRDFLQIVQYCLGEVGKLKTAFYSPTQVEEIERLVRLKESFTIESEFCT